METQLITNVISIHVLWYLRQFYKNRTSFYAIQLSLGNWNESIL